MLLCALALCAGVLGWTAWQKLWSFWLDEAMLLTAVEHVGTVAGLFRPLPLYDQGMPTGFLLIAWLMHKAALPLLTQKLLPILASGAVVAAVVAAARRSGLGATATMVSLFTLLAANSYSYAFGNFKHYAFEMLAISLVLLAAVSERRSAAISIVAASIIGLLLTFATPIILVMLVFLYGRVSTRLLITIIALLAVAFGAGYSLYLGAALHLNLTNYDYIYDKGYLPLSPGALNTLAHIVMSHAPALPFATYRLQRLFTLFALFGAAVALIRRERSAMMFVAVLLVLSVLSVLHRYPFLEGRFSGYLLPFVVLFLGRGVQTIVTAMRPLQGCIPVRAIPAARVAKQVALVLLVGFGLVCFRTNGGWFATVGPLPYSALAAADAANPDVIVPLGLVQPQVDLVRSARPTHTQRFLEVNATSAPRPSNQTIQRHPPDLVEEPGAWALVIRAEQVRLNWLQATDPLTIDDYFGWLLTQAGSLHSAAFIAPTCMVPPDVHFAQFMRRLAETGEIRELDKTACYSTVLWTRNG